MSCWKPGASQLSIHNKNTSCPSYPSRSSCRNCLSSPSDTRDPGSMRKSGSTSQLRAAYRQGKPVHDRCKAIAGGARAGRANSGQCIARGYWCMTGAKRVLNLRCGLFHPPTSSKQATSQTTPTPFIPHTTWWYPFTQPILREGSLQNVVNWPVSHVQCNQLVSVYTTHTP